MSALHIPPYLRPSYPFRLTCLQVDALMSSYWSTLMHRLILVWTPHLHAIRIGPPPAPAAVPVLEGVARLDLNYWPAKSGGWTTVWNDPIPPRLVRIKIAFSDTSELGWPDLLAAPMLDPP